MQRWPRGSSPRSRGTRSELRQAARHRRFIPALAGNTHGSVICGCACSVHPRARGEHACNLRALPLEPGSSPRSRGTQLAPPSPAACARFIPALAGNTPGPWPARRRWSVHPRARGEHSPGPLIGSRPGGSSPRSRGTLDSTLGNGTHERFIPALAGNTCGHVVTVAYRTVHPRARGEHAEGPDPGDGAGGSSPRSRGTRVATWSRSPTGRFIPALAGNTLKDQIQEMGLAVHPRARGEHVVIQGFAVDDSGSSPRSRGTLGRTGTAPPGTRFIPALAGNTFAFLRRNAPGTVHPRARGEHASYLSKYMLKAGSSPRSRGTRQLRNTPPRARRFIPALAGNTRPRSTFPPSLPVHPRARGEHLLTTGLACYLGGSSPRSRGTPPCPIQQALRRRFIPALAGNTPSSSLRRSCQSVHPRARGEHQAER